MESKDFADAIALAIQDLDAKQVIEQFPEMQDHRTVLVRLIRTEALRCGHQLRADNCERKVEWYEQQLKQALGVQNDD